MGFFSDIPLSCQFFDGVNLVQQIGVKLFQRHSFDLWGDFPLSVAVPNCVIKHESHLVLE
jgi:hypothetical protein